MKILWFSWKDSEHPLAGGAEVVKSQICKRLSSNGHQVIQLTAGFENAPAETQLEGCRVIRVGGRFTVYPAAWRYYQKHLKDWPDIIIDECNTIPFFTQFYARQKRAMVIYQLAREVWFYQMPKPLSWLGYVIEPFYIRLLKYSKVITICQSTLNELNSLGFDPDNIEIIRMGSDFPILKTLDRIEKYTEPTLLYLGSLREMKRPDQVVKAFELSRQTLPHLKLIIAGCGSGKYFESLQRLIDNSPFKCDISCMGRVSEDEKKDMMQKSHLIAVTSVKEGWGLIVTEAASQGTPAVVYNVDGLRDSVRNEQTGLHSPSNPEALSKAIIRLLSDKALYDTCRYNGWQWSQDLTFDNCYADFCHALEIK